MDVPRSIVQCLEDEIAVLERQTPVFDPTLSSSSVPDEQGSARQKVIASRDVRSMVGSVVPTDLAVTDVVSLVRMGLTPSLPLSTAAHSQLRRKRIGANEVMIPVLAGLPMSVVHGLVRKYVQMILPTYPFLYEPTVWEQLSKVQAQVKQACLDSPQQPKIQPDYDFLVIYLILAVSASLGLTDNPHRERCRRLSESLFREGIHHYASNALLRNDLAGIQTTLLILQYARNP